jgi:hypothetical protein
LPAIESALRKGTLSFSAVKAVSRVAIVATDQEWLEAVVGKQMRVVERLVSGKAPGDRPTDQIVAPRTCKMMLRLKKPANHAALRKLRAELSEEHGYAVDDDTLIEALLEARSAVRSSGRKEAPGDVSRSDATPRDALPTEVHVEPKGGVSRSALLGDRVTAPFHDEAPLDASEQVETASQMIKLIGKALIAFVPRGRQRVPVRPDAGKDVGS